MLPKYVGLNAMKLDLDQWTLQAGFSFLCSVKHGYLLDIVIRHYRHGESETMTVGAHEAHSSYHRASDIIVSHDDKQRLYLCFISLRQDHMLMRWHGAHELCLIIWKRWQVRACRLPEIWTCMKTSWHPFIVTKIIDFGKHSWLAEENENKLPLGLEYINKALQGGLWPSSVFNMATVYSSFVTPPASPTSWKLWRSEGVPGHRNRGR